MKLSTILVKRKKGNNMKPGIALMENRKILTQRVKLQYIKQNILVYQTMPAGIGEHSDITEAVIEELINFQKFADDRLEMINKYFPETMNG